MDSTSSGIPYIKKQSQPDNSFSYTPTSTISIQCGCKPYIFNSRHLIFNLNQSLQLAFRLSWGRLQSYLKRFLVCWGKHKKKWVYPTLGFSYVFPFAINKTLNTIPDCISANFKNSLDFQLFHDIYIKVN